jgi:hypothetical protein
MYESKTNCDMRLYPYNSALLSFMNGNFAEGKKEELNSYTIQKYRSQKGKQNEPKCMVKV